MKKTDLIKSLSKELNLSEEVIDKVYKSYWLTIKNLIEQQSIEDLKHFSINIPSIGKFFSNEEFINNVNKRYNYIKQLLENDKDKED